MRPHSKRRSQQRAPRSVDGRCVRLLRWHSLLLRMRLSSTRRCDDAATHPSPVRGGRCHHMPDDDSQGDVWLSLGRDVELTSAVRFQRDLYLYWQTAQRMGGLPLTTRGYVTRLALRRLCDRLAAVRQETSRLELGEAEAPELLFLRRLLERLRLLQRASDTPRLVAADWSEMGRYIALPLAERLRLAARLWVAGGWWPDQITASLQPPRLLTPAPPRLALARRRLLITLASLPRGAELPVPPARAPILPPKHHRPARLGAGREAAHTPDGVEESWRAALLGPLTWLGLVVSRPESGTGRELRSVGEAAAALAGEGPMPSLAEVHGPLALLPNLTLLAYPPLTAPALWRLDVCCEESALQQTASYTLTRRALARARK